MSESNIATDKGDVYSRVTQQIITAIEQSLADNWRAPWHNAGTANCSPINVTSGKAYRGVNILALWAQAQAKGYASGEWGTYKQWSERKAQVRKGEKASTVVFWKFQDKESETGDADTPAIGSTLVFARGYSVFNADQVDGYTPNVEPERPAFERIAEAESFFGQLRADVRYGGNSAHYSPLFDYVQMPPFEKFRDAESFYAVLAHELTHWTSHSSRLDRQLGKRFGDSAYAAEELIAELGAAFTLARMGLATEPREDHAKYIQTWLRVLKSDKRAIFTAASQAQKAADYLMQKANPAAEMAA